MRMYAYVCNAFGSCSRLEERSKRSAEAPRAPAPGPGPAEPRAADTRKFCDVAEGGV